MALPIFPIPMPGGAQRTFDFGENITLYDSGERQADTPYSRPLYRWNLPISVMNEIKQSSLETFMLGRKGMTKPFLVKDGYDFAVNSNVAVRSGITNAATLYIFDTNSFMTRPDTTTVGSMFSSLSGYVRLGVEYALDQDSGILTVNTKAATDVWGVRSMQYYRKAAFSTQYIETSPIWNIFAVNLQIGELP